MKTITHPESRKGASLPGDGSTSRIQRGLLLLNLVTLYGCEDLAIRDTSSLLLPSFQRPARTTPAGADHGALVFPRRRTLFRNKRLGCRGQRRGPDSSGGFYGGADYQNLREGKKTVNE